MWQRCRRIQHGGPCNVANFPVSVFVAGLLVKHIGPAPFFPLAGALLAVAIAISLSQRSWRTFGSAANAQPAEGQSPPAAGAASRQPQRLSPAPYRN